MRYLTSCLLALMLSGLSPASQLLPSPTEEKGTYLGVLFSPVPESLLDHLPHLPRDQGVMVTHVLPDSPAMKAKLRRHDILLKYDETEIRDCDHFAELIRNDQPEKKVELALIRQGKATTATVTLSLGPVLRIARAESRSEPSPTKPGTAKQGAPSKLSVLAEPLDGNRMKVIFELYQPGTGKFRQVTCSGTPEVLDREVRTRLPKPYHPLAEAALKRLRQLNFQSAKDPTP